MSSDSLKKTDAILKEGREFLHLVESVELPSSALKPSEMWQAHLENTHRKAIREVKNAEEIIELVTSKDFFSCPCVKADYHFDAVRRTGLRFFEKPGYELDSLPEEICESSFSGSEACFEHNGRRLSTAFLWHLAAALRMRERIGGNLKRMMEIGSGYGGLARIMKLLNKGMTYYLVDLPECLVFAYAFLKKNFPEADVHLVTDGKIPASGDFVLVPVCFLNQFPREGVDLVFNSQSFSEMTQGAFDYYLDFIQNHINPRYFYNINRYLEHADGVVIEGRFERGVSIDAASNTAALDAHWNVLYWALSEEDHCASWDPRFQRVLELLVERIPIEQRSEEMYARQAEEMRKELKGALRADSRWHYLMWNVNRIAPSPQSLELYIAVLETLDYGEVEYYIRQWISLFGDKTPRTCRDQSQWIMDTRCYRRLWSKFFAKIPSIYLRKDAQGKAYLTLKMDAKDSSSSFQSYVSSIVEKPTVSIFMFCKNRKNTIQRALESILNQTYPYMEIIVQDGASTDGTLEILQKYQKRIKLVSAPDAGPAEAFWTALKRCTGDIIGSCLSDEEIMPDVAEFAVEFFHQNPSAGALTRDGYLVELNGAILGEVLGPKEFDIKKYMANEFAPHFCASFFNRDALESVGLYTREWLMDCGEFELWCRLALAAPVVYQAGFASKYAYHNDQLSRNPENMLKIFRGRIKVIEKLFIEEKIPDFSEAEKTKCMVETALSFAEHFKRMEEYDKANQMMRFCQNSLGRAHAT
ncbi:MAG: putative sugar O-methyltransferase [Verrucomicrobiota bacterium]